MVNKNVLIVAVVGLLIVASVGFILLAETEEREPKITLLSQVNSEGSAIFVSSDIATGDKANWSDNFGGKVFATPGTASIQHMILADYIASETDFGFAIQPAGALDDNVVYWTQVPPIDMKESMSKGLVDGGIAWEPFNSQIVADVPGVEIYKWTDEIWDAHPCCVLAVNSEFEQKNPETVQKFVAAHVVATKWIMETIQDDTSDNYSYMVNISSIFAFGDKSEANKAIAKDSLGHVTYDYNINQSWKDKLEVVIDTYTRLGLFDRNPEQLGYESSTEFVERLVNTDYIDNASATDVVDEGDGLVKVKVGWLSGDIHQLARLVAMDKNIGEGMGFGDRTIFEAFGIEIEGGAGNPYANGGAVMDAFLADEIDFGYLGAPPAILRTVNALS